MTTLLEDIQNDAVDASKDLSTLLRKCKLLAARLGSQQLEDWLLWESNGYPDDVRVPEYRVWPLRVKGHFSGSFGSGIKNAPIPTVLLPKEVRESYERYECQLSIAVVESALRKNKSGAIQVSTGDLALVLGTNVYEHQNCVQAWAEFSTANLVELLNSVRNRLLDFTLAVWKAEPSAGESPSSSATALKPDQLTQIFNTTVYGGAANVLGTAVESTVAFNVAPNNFESLRKILKNNSVSDEDIGALEAALKKDDPPSSEGRFGPRVSTWIASMMKKASEGSWGVGIATGGNLLAQVISKFYGL